MHASAIYYLKANVFLSVNNTSEIYPVYDDLNKGSVGTNSGPSYSGQEMQKIINTLPLHQAFKYN